MFDILVHRFDDPVTDARVLDLFAGSGALGLEALSRGAASCLMVEQSAEARGFIRLNIETLGLTGRTRIFRRDATKLGDIGKMAPYGLVLADPPYGEQLGEAALAATESGHWLTPGAICVLEEVATAEVKPSAGFALLGQRLLGDTLLTFLRWDGSE